MSIGSVLFFAANLVVVAGAISAGIYFLKRRRELVKKHEGEERERTRLNWGKGINRVLGVLTFGWLAFFITVCVVNDYPVSTWQLYEWVIVLGVPVVLWLLRYPGLWLVLWIRDGFRETQG